MSFTSWQYLLFLPVIVIIYWRLGYRGRILLILAGNYLFYGMWDARFLALIFSSTVVDYFCGLSIAGQRERFLKVFLLACVPACWLAGYWLHTGSSMYLPALEAPLMLPAVWGSLYWLFWRLPEPQQKRAFMLLSVFTNLGVLAFFKYANFMADSFASMLAVFGIKAGWTLPHIILPIAISFYTFQSICYTVDIYREKSEPLRDFLPFAAYLSFFPQLVSGPLERPAVFAPQFRKAADWNPEHIHAGARLMLTGFFKKMFVADSCAMLANYAFSPDNTNLNAYWAIIGSIAFAFQIYGDFSGYTDIARGSARMLGINLSVNFRFPYIAKDPSDFWRRWHITLSEWFRDYVYIPLGGNRGSSRRTLINLGVTMLLAGIWHGANWKYVLWGGYWGGFLIIFHSSPSWKRFSESASTSSLKMALAVSGMWIITLAGWVIFRCNDMSGLLVWIRALGNWNPLTCIVWHGAVGWLAAHIVPLLILQAITIKRLDESSLELIPRGLRGAVYLAMFLMITSSASGYQEFIYFQF